MSPKITTSAPMDNSSSSSGHMRPYGTPEATEDAKEREADLERASQRSPRSGSELLRTVSQYTEYSLNTGEARREAQNELDEPDLVEKQEAQKAGFWSKSNKPLRKTFLKQWPAIIMILTVYVFAVFSIYWGSLYKRGTRLHNLKVLVSLEDNENAVISQTLTRSLQNPAVSSVAGWVVRGYMPESEIIHLVRTEKYWGALYVTGRNVSSEFVSAFQHNSTLNTSSLVMGYYETSRDMNGVSQYLRPALQRASAAFSNVMLHNVYPEIISNLSNTQFAALRSNPILSAVPELTLVDGTATPNPVLIAPLQVGLIYLIILSLFQIMWFMKLSGEVAQKLKSINYIFYRLLMVQVNSLVISFVYTVLNRAFQVNLTLSWKGGFGVFWMAAYLTMAACTGANENIFILSSCTMPPALGLWMLMFVILNITGTFSPIELCPKIFRFTYAMPIKNGYEWMKIILLGSYKGHLGRYIGVLIAWIVVNSLLMPFCLLFFSSRTKKRMQAEVEKSEEKTTAK